MIAVLDYGMGNIHSIVKALRLFHDDVQFTADANALKSCRALVLPGDGHFTAAMNHLPNEYAVDLNDATLPIDNSS